MALVLIQGAIFAVLLHRQSYGESIDERWYVIAQWLLVPKFFLLFVLIPFLIQSPMPMEADDQPRLRLEFATARTLFLAVVAMAPMILAEFGIFQYVGVSLGDSFILCAEALLWWSLVVMALVLVASLTPNLGHYVLVCAIGVPAGLLCIYAGETIKATSLSLLLGHPYHFRNWIDFSLLTSAGLVSAALFLVGSVVLFVFYQWTRRWKASIRAMAILFILCALNLDMWPWDFTRSLLYRSYMSGPSYDPQQIDVRIDPKTSAYHQSDFNDFGHTADGIFVSANTWVHGQDPAVFCCAEIYQSRFIVNGKTEVESGPLRSLTMIGVNDANYLEPLFPGAKILNPFEPPPLGGWKLPYLRMRLSDFERLQTTSGTLDVTMNFSAMRYRKVAELPLLPGAELKQGSNRVRILAIEKDHGQLNVKIVATEAVPLFVGMDSYFDRCPLRFLLYNSQRNEIYMRTQLISHDSSKSALSAVYPRTDRGHVYIHSYQLAFATERSPLNKKLSIPGSISDDWLKDAKLICVQLKKVGSVTKEIEVPGLVLGAIHRE